MRLIGRKFLIETAPSSFGINAIKEAPISPTILSLAWNSVKKTKNKQKNIMDYRMPYCKPSCLIKMMIWIIDRYYLCTYCNNEWASASTSTHMRPTFWSLGLTTNLLHDQFSLTIKYTINVWRASYGDKKHSYDSPLEDSLRITTIGETKLPDWAPIASHWL